MRTYTFTTTISPMDDADLAYNFKKARRDFWIKKGLWIPDNAVVRFGKIKKTRAEIGKPPLCGSFDGVREITISPELAYMYWAAHITLLHEMAHMYIAWEHLDCRHSGHGKTFHKEIDRLYSLGAFRRLI